MSVTVTRKIVVNGKEYHSVDELPPDVRAMYDRAMASADNAVLAGIAFALYRGL